jgi:hypothetical protein
MSSARDALKACLPDAFKMDSFVAFLKEDVTTTRWLQQLLDTVLGGGNTLAMSTGTPLHSRSNISLIA